MVKHVARRERKKMCRGERRMKGEEGEKSVSVCGPACVNSVKPTRSASATAHRHARAPRSSQKDSRSTDFDFNAVADRVEHCVGRQEEQSSIVAVSSSLKIRVCVSMVKHVARRERKKMRRGKRRMKGGGGGAERERVWSRLRE